MINTELRKEYDEAIKVYLKTKSINKTCKICNIKTRKLFSNYLKEKGYIIKNIQNELHCNENVFKTINCEESAYWLGFLYADGYVNRDRNRLELGLKDSDIKHIKKFKYFTECDNSIINKSSKLGNSVRIGMSSKQLIEDLSRLGCQNCKSLTLKFPTYNQVPKEYMLDFMRGYFDGDGYLGIREILRLKDENVRLYPRCALLGTYDFISGYLLELDFSFNNKQINKKGKIFQYTFNDNECWIMLDLLYEKANVYLDRKYEKYINLKYNQINLPSL